MLLPYLAQTRVVNLHVIFAYTYFLIDKSYLLWISGIIFLDNGVKWYCIVQLNFIEQEKFNISCVANSNVQELMRGIRTQMDSLISLPTKEMSAMALGLAHRYILLLYQHLVLDAVNKGWMQKGSICFFNQQTPFTLIPETVVSFI